MTVLKLEKLCKTYSAARSSLLSLSRYLPTREAVGIQAVRSISLTVNSGETLGIVGESGCGKSTLARMLAGLTTPTSGSIELECKPLPESIRQIGKTLQYVFQDPLSSLNPRKRIRQILEAPMLHLHHMDAGERNSRLQELLAAVNLQTEFLQRYPHEFSGGQAQRIGLARALAANPRILILDEPVSALDVSVQAQVLNLLNDLKQQYALTYLFISHDLAVVEAVSDRVAVLYCGQLVELGDASSLFRQPGHPYTQLLSNSAPQTGRQLIRQSGADSELPDPLKPPAACAFASRCSHATELCQRQSPTLGKIAEGRFVACHYPLNSRRSVEDRRVQFGPSR